MNASQLFKYWRQVRSSLLEVLDKLEDSHLDYSPRPGLWSVREVIAHIASAEEGWLEFYTKNKNHENPPQASNYPTIASLKKLLEETHVRTEKHFSVNPDDMLEQTCLLPWGSETTLGWAVWHVLEHEIHHRGEIYLMLGLLGMEAPDV